MLRNIRSLIVLIAVSFILFINGCGIATQTYGIKGNVYNSVTSNEIVGIQIRLYNSSLTESSLSLSNGYYSVDFSYHSGGCTTATSMSESDRNQDFYVEIKDMDGTNNGAFQDYFTNIGKVFSSQAIIQTIDFYLVTN